MAKMNIPYFTIRLLTVCCYFLPFIFFLSTCTDGRTSKEAFNKTEAIQNEQERTDNKLMRIDELVNESDSTSKENMAARLKELDNRSDHSANLEAEVAFFFLMPTPYSLSGIGVIYHHKNMIGSILMGISLAISLITLFVWPLLKRKNWSLAPLEANLIVNIAFFVDCLATDVTMLYGFYVLVFLLLIQLITEMQARRLTLAT